MGEQVNTVHHSASKPLSGRALRKRSDVIREATSLFATQDYHAVLMDDVATAAAIGKGTIYRYFASKEDLFVACVESAFDEIVDVIHTMKHDETIPYRERLRAIVRRLVEFFMENGNMFRIMHHERAFRCGRQDGGSSIRERWTEVRNIIRTTVENGVSHGEFRPVDGAIVTAAVFGMVRGLVGQLSGRSIDDIGAAAADIILDGIAS
ncbi:MAG: TetR/AcrR family transcriptional regulator [Planctomycetes bacterium]|nr:TetR/AcrR family transcriptional regulator [Planctomycetota bacterium]